MLRKLILALALSSCPNPALALDWIIFDRDNNPVECRINSPQPVPGVDCPEETTVKAWTMYADENGNLDRDYRNYTPVLTGVRRVRKQEPVQSDPGPNVEGFYADLAASGKFTDEEFGQALRCRYILDSAQRDVAIIKYASSLSPEKLQALAEIAQKNRMPLPLP